MGQIDFITIIIIGANVLMSFKGFGDYTFFENYKFQVGRIQGGEQKRIISSGFLHGDTQHLLFNMLTLFFFADGVIYEFGQVRFVIIYFVSLVLGGLLSLHFHKNEPYYSAVGASGAVMGVLYSAILLDPSMRLQMFFIPIKIPAYVLGIGYLLYTIYGMKNRNDNIGHDAHFGGAIAGYAITLIFAPELFETELNFIILLVIPIILLFVLKKLGKI